MTIREVTLNEEVLSLLCRFSEDWEAENSCHGYRANGPGDIEGNRIFLADDGDRTVGYLFGHRYVKDRPTSVIPEGAACFEVMELYVTPEYRSRGVGRALMRHVEAAVRPESEYITLSTATKNWRAIMHFYIDELDMRFWSAALYKPLRDGAPSGGITP